LIDVDGMILRFALLAVALEINVTQNFENVKGGFSL